MFTPKCLLSALHRGDQPELLYGGFLPFLGFSENPTEVDCVNHSACDCSRSVLKCGMPTQKRKHITDQQWERDADAYERGTRHGVDIAAELGVSPATVSREFKRRGCVKASRVAEVMAPIKAELDRRAHRRAVFRRAQEKAAMQRAAANDRLINDMMRAIVAAMKAGDLSKAAPKVAEVGKALGVKQSR